MSYFAPYIDSTGAHFPLYSDILAYLISNYQSIYGQDSYLGNDAADYQWISSVSKIANDTMLALQQDYNNRSPLTAVGVPLDGLVKLNGLTRKVATSSSCIVDLIGTVGVVINNGIVSDSSGNYWDLPAIVTFDEDGLASVSATCETVGAISALPGSITKIVTPQLGWASVNNSVAAIVGQPIETDAQLRARQSLSTRLASHTMLSGTEAAIAAIENVTRYNVHENYTDYIDSNGCPPHSVTAVVEGGDDADIANAIFLNRGIGPYMNGFQYESPVPEGSTTVVVADPDTGEEMTIGFLRAEYVPIYVTMNIKKLTGYTDSTTTQIKEAVVNYLNSLQIGEDLTISALYGAALAVMPSLQTPMFSITSLEAGVNPYSLGTSDIAIAFNAVTQGIDSTSPEFIVVNAS